MTDIRSAWTVENYVAPDGVAWRIAIFHDEDAESPRSDRDTNMAELLTASRYYYSPDRGQHADPLDIMTRETSYGTTWTSRMCGMYLAARTDVVGWAMLDQDERDGSLSVHVYASSDEIGDKMHSGVAYIMRDRWNEMMGKDYDGSITPVDVIRQEVEMYNSWCRGEFCRFVVEHEQGWQSINADGTDRTMTTWEEPADVGSGSVGGFDDQDYALEEARFILPEGSVRAV